MAATLMPGDALGGKRSRSGASSTYGRDGARVEGFAHAPEGGSAELYVRAVDKYGNVTFSRASASPRGTSSETSVNGGRSSGSGPWPVYLVNGGVPIATEAGYWVSHYTNTPPGPGRWHSTQYYINVHNSSHSTTRTPPPGYTSDTRGYRIQPATTTTRRRGGCGWLGLRPC